MSFLISKKKDTGWITPALIKSIDSLPLCTWEELTNRTFIGAKWVVIQGLVLDVAVWSNNHPGGKFLLENSAGTDSTMQFIGGDIFASNLRCYNEWCRNLQKREHHVFVSRHKHNHTFPAKAKIAQLAIAKFEHFDLDSFSQVHGSNEDSGSHNANSIENKECKDAEIDIVNDEHYVVTRPSFVQRLYSFGLRRRATRVTESTKNAIAMGDKEICGRLFQYLLIGKDQVSAFDGEGAPVYVFTFLLSTQAYKAG